jgi:hypothetical protein
MTSHLLVWFLPFFTVGSASIPRSEMNGPIGAQRALADVHPGAFADPRRRRFHAANASFPRENARYIQLRDNKL